MRGSNQSLNFSIPNGVALSSPATIENPARMISGIVIVRSDSCGWPCPRYSPKKVR